MVKHQVKQNELSGYSIRRKAPSIKHRQESVGYGRSARYTTSRQQLRTLHHTFLLQAYKHLRQETAWWKPWLSRISDSYIYNCSQLSALLSAVKVQTPTCLQLFFRHKTIVPISSSNFSLSQLQVKLAVNESEKNLDQWKYCGAVLLLSSLLCFSPLTGIGLIYFIKAMRLSREGDEKKALSHKKTAMRCGLAGVLIGTLCLAAVLTVYFVPGISSAASSFSNRLVPQVPSGNATTDRGTGTPSPGPSTNQPSIRLLINDRSTRRVDSSLAIPQRETGATRLDWTRNNLALTTASGRENYHITLDYIQHGSQHKIPSTDRETTTDHKNNVETHELINT